jgi:uncharacterized membrane protein YuzA (DUF378 family)
VWARWLIDPVTGKSSVGRAFWLYGLGGSVAYSIIGWLLDPRTPAAITAYVLVGLAIGVLQSLILWQCAPNSRSVLLGRFTRAAAILGLITIPIMLYLLFKNGPTLLPPDSPWSGL